MRLDFILTSSESNLKMSLNRSLAFQEFKIILIQRLLQVGTLCLSFTSQMHLVIDGDKKPLLKQFRSDQVLNLKLDNGSRRQVPEKGQQI